MKISIDIKRVALTAITCFVIAILPFFVPTTELVHALSVPLLFSIAIPLTNFDRITTRKKSQAFVLSAMLTTLLLFVCTLLGILFGQSFLAAYAFLVLCVASGLLVLMINSLFIKIDNLKYGLTLTGLISFSIPPLTTYLNGRHILGIIFFHGPATFFIIWQSAIGLAIALSIWTKTSNTKTIQE